MSKGFCESTVAVYLHHKKLHDEYDRLDNCNMDFRDYNLCIRDNKMFKKSRKIIGMKETSRRKIFSSFDEFMASIHEDMKE